MSKRAPIIAILIALGTASGCRVNRAAPDHSKEQVLYTATISDPRTFNPLLVTDAVSDRILAQLFEGLVNVNPVTTLPEPDVASSWELSDGGKTITFHLRRDVKWFDGQPLTARDVLFTLSAIYDPRVPNSLRPILTIDGQPIKASAPDDYTVVMRMPRPFAPILYSIGFGILPEHLLREAHDSGGFNRVWGIDTSPDKIVGMGPFRMTRYVPAQFVSYIRNPDYWMRDENGARLPRLRGRELLIVQDQNAAYLKFLSGQIDAHSPRPEEVLDLRNKAASMRITIREIGIDAGDLFFSFNRNPRHYVRNGVTDPKLRWFTDLNFLRAIAHAVDKRSMISLCFHGLGEPAVASISPANRIFHDPNLKDYDYDLKLAAQLLESAGYHLVKPGVRVDPGGVPIEFNLMTSTGAAVADKMCAIFKQDLANLGIRVDYRPLEFTTVVEKLDSSFDWDCVLIGFTGGDVEPNNGANVYRSSGNLHLWNPGQKTPATPWEAEIDRLLDQGSAEMDTSKRAPYYWRIQEILHGQLPVIETVRQEDFTAYKNQLEDYNPTVWGPYRPELIRFRAE